MKKDLWAKASQFDINVEFLGFCQHYKGRHSWLAEITGYCLIYPHCRHCLSGTKQYAFVETNCAIVLVIAFAPPDKGANIIAKAGFVFRCQDASEDQQSRAKAHGAKNCPPHSRSMVCRS